MPRFHRLSQLLCACSLCAALIPAPAVASSRRVNGSLAPRGSVKDFLFTPDGQWIVYVADQTTYGQDDVYSVPAGGGTPTRRNPSISDGTTVETVQASHDARWIVYALTKRFRTVALFSVELRGEGVRLLGDWRAGGAIGRWQISADSRQVVFEAHGSEGAPSTLYRAPLDGTAPPTAISGDLLIANFECCGGDHFALSPNGQYALFIAQPQGIQERRLYRTSLAGGAPVLLSAPLPPNTAVQTYLISADSQQIIYSVGNSNYSNATALYRVSATGDHANLLAAAAGEGEAIGSFAFGIGDSLVVYQTRRRYDVYNEYGPLYRVPLTGGTPTSINGPLPADKGVTSFRISPDGATIAYIVGNQLIGADMLYRAPLVGGTPLLLATVPNADAYVAWFEFSPDSQRLVYGMTRKLRRTTDLFSAQLTTGATLPLCELLPEWEPAFNSIAFAPDSTRVLVTDYNTLSQAPLRTGGWSDLVYGPQMWSPVVFNRSGTAALYRADDGNDTLDLYRIDSLYRVFLPRV